MHQGHLGLAIATVGYQCARSGWMAIHQEHNQLAIAQVCSMVRAGAVGVS